MKITHEDRKRIGTSCHEAALKYLQKGLTPLALCPPNHVGIGLRSNHASQCKTPGKSPWDKWGHLIAGEKQTADAINRAWRWNCQSNVGLVLGHQIIRIDVDGEFGERLLVEVSDDDVPDTWTFHRPGTRSRGLIYRVPPGLIVKTTAAAGIGDHKELRLQGRGSQTVVPPSLHADGTRYTWVAGLSPDDGPCAVMPRWLVRMMRDDEKPRTPQRSFDFDAVPESVDRITDDDLLDFYREQYGTRFTRLFDDGEWEGRYPSQSEADAALLNFMCQGGTDFATVDRLFRRSKLMRTKWDRKDYRDRTIAFAASQGTPRKWGAITVPKLNNGTEAAHVRQH